MWSIAWKHENGLHVIHRTKFTIVVHKEFFLLCRTYSDKRINIRRQDIQKL